MSLSDDEQAELAQFDAELAEALQLLHVVMVDVENAGDSIRWVLEIRSNVTTVQSLDPRARLNLIPTVRPALAELFKSHAKHNS